MYGCVYVCECVPGVCAGDFMWMGILVYVWVYLGERRWIERCRVVCVGGIVWVLVWLWVAVRRVY